MITSIEEIRNTIKRNDLQYIRLQFTDLLGDFKNIELPISQFEKVVKNEIMFDSSSITGFTAIYDSDMYLYPDWSTFAVIPKDMDEEGVVRVICDCVRPNGSYYEGDPRGCLKEAVKKATRMGYEKVLVGPEPEFFLLTNENIPVDEGGYFDLSPKDKGEAIRRKVVSCLRALGFEVEALHHEVAKGQYEIDWKYDDAVNTADKIQTFKWVVQTIAKNHNVKATFMPKPFKGTNGSGMHVHLSLTRNNENTFYNETDKMELSDDAYHFIGGILAFSKHNALFTNPTINSYKRLVPGYEAPVYIAWSPSNRSCLIRIPEARKMATRVEVRNPDPSCNPYLALSVLIRAGLTGIANRLTPPTPQHENLFSLTEEEKNRKHIETLPTSLEESIVSAVAQKEYFEEILGKHIIEEFIKLKKKELEEFRLSVTDWEYDKYL